MASMPPFLYAVHNDDLVKVQSLINEGANVNAKYEVMLYYGDWI